MGIERGVVSCLYEIAIIICNFPLRIQLENKILTRVLMRERPVTPVKPLVVWFTNDLAVCPK